MELIDLHCHILPFVDDGAANMEEALELLSMEAEQGVTTICLTPHLRDKMFQSPDGKILENFRRLVQESQEAEIPVQLYLSREYYFDSQFRGKLEERSLLPMGNEGVILVEFSYRSSFETLREAVNMIRSAGYSPMIAHAERYHCIQEDPELAGSLARIGAKIQVNANSILGLDGRKEKKASHYILKHHYAYIVASDAHDTEVRIPKLAECEAFLEKKFGREYAQKLLQENPLSILRN